MERGCKRSSSPIICDKYIYNMDKDETVVYHRRCRNAITGDNADTQELRLIKSYCTIIHSESERSLKIRVCVCTSIYILQHDGNTVVTSECAIICTRTKAGDGYWIGVIGDRSTSDRYLLETFVCSSNSTTWNSGTRKISKYINN